MTEKLTKSENLRIAHVDLDSIYDIFSQLDKLRFFLLQKTQLKLQNTGFYLFVHLKDEVFTLGVPVVGIPVESSLSDEYYIEDYGQTKTLQLGLKRESFLAKSEVEMLETLRDMAIKYFSEGPKPEVVRVFVSDWQSVSGPHGENDVKVDFFLD